MVVAAVGDLDKLTYEKSAMVERTTHRANRLMERTRDLDEAVHHMMLRQGTADEAYELVQKALAHIQAVGYDQAARDMQNREGPFVDRDLSIFVLDREGTYRVMRLDPAKVGTRVHDTSGIDADAFMADVLHRVEQGGGRVEYNISIRSPDECGRNRLSSRRCPMASSSAVARTVAPSNRPPSASARRWVTDPAGSGPPARAAQWRLCPRIARLCCRGP